MKKVIRNIIFSTVTIYILSLINPGFSFNMEWRTLILAGFVMFFLDTIVEPVVKIIFLPINFLTLGLFSWIIGAGLVFALQYFVPELSISGWNFDGIYYPVYQQFNLNIPPISFNFWTNLVLISVLYNLISGTMKWLCE